MKKVQFKSYGWKASVAVMLGTLVGLAVFPGIDLASYWFLKPTGFLQKAAFCLAVGLTFWHLILLAMLAGMAVITLLAITFDI